jgi:hypothetical protein
VAAPSNAAASPGNAGGGSATLLDITEPTRPVFATIPVPDPDNRFAHETDLESIEGDLQAFGTSLCPGQLPRSAVDGRRPGSHHPPNANLLRTR